MGSQESQRQTLAQANQTQNPPLHLNADELTPLPTPPFQARTSFGDLPCHCHNQRDGMLGSSFDITGGGIDDDDS